MLRQTHSLPGLIAAILLIVLAITGALLSVDPALDRVGTAVPARGQVSAAALAEQVARHYPNVEQIQRSPSGSVIVYYSANGQARADRIDPFSGRSIGSYAPSSFTRWIKNLHRSFLSDTPGRAVAGLSALTMLMLCISGIALLQKRLGGWRQLIGPLRGNFSQRWHTELGRLAVVGLLLSAITGLYLSATSFGLVSDGLQNEAAFPTVVATGPAMPIGTMPALLHTDLNDLRELVYPAMADPNGLYSISTAQGNGYIDQSTGKLLSFQAHNGMRKSYQLVYKLHTGEGLWWLGLLLGLCALSVPLMSATGVAIWWQRRRSMPRIIGNVRPQSADAVILVGSENNSTWGFAQTLHDALRKTGRHVHTAPMSQLAHEYRKARHMFILTSTYGDGDAPSSATKFLARLDAFSSTQRPEFAVLGFGDSQFPNFCRFARDVHDAMQSRGWREFLAFETVNRQSCQDFARWGQAMGHVLGQEVILQHTPRRTRTRALELISRTDYGVQVQAPTSILRFGPVASQSRMARFRRLIGFNGLPSFEAGDLVGILPPGSPVPRFYSLASGSRNGFLEICVRKQPGGLCSEMLHGLQAGDRIDTFIQPNPNFRPASGRAPVVLISAGAGIGPLAGFIRNNTNKHPMYLYWGGRDPASDFLYERELTQYLADRRLTELHSAFSRIKAGAYVQDRILDDAKKLCRLIQSGAQVLVCGSRAMASSTKQALDRILVPLGLDVQTLKLQGRYREDIF